MHLATSQQANRSDRLGNQRSGDRDIAAELAWRVLDELDYGLILVDPDGRVQHANHLARQELGRARFLRSDHDVIGGLAPAAHAELQRGIRAAARGRRQLLEFREGSETLSVACVPLFHPLEGVSDSVLLMLGRQRGTHNLALTFFARAHRLTPAEEAVLRALCEGGEVHEIAAAHGVCISTIRTQIRSLRDKTGANSIRELVQRLAALPPVVPVSLAAGGKRAAQWAL
jgi:DNA-binding CsgD family transcriptional regulator